MVNIFNTPHNSNHLCWAEIVTGPASFQDAISWTLHINLHRSLAERYICCLRKWFMPSILSEVYPAITKFLKWARSFLSKPLSELANKNWTGYCTKELCIEKTLRILVCQAFHFGKRFCQALNACQGLSQNNTSVSCDTGEA